MCSFLPACYLQIATVIQLNQLKSGNELPRCFGALVEIEELQGRFGVRLIDQLHLRDGKGLAEELGGALRERGDWVKASLCYLTTSEKRPPLIPANLRQHKTALPPLPSSALIPSAPSRARSR